MPITEQHRKEDLGQAYVSAVIAKAGYNISHDRHDDYHDGTIKEVACFNGHFFPTGFGINYQLKSTCDVIFQGEHILYDLESKNYNELVRETTMFPSILILFVLPKDEHEWLTVSCDELVIRKCAWWYSLVGLPPTDNTASKRICVPQNQILTPDSLIKLMEKVKGAEKL